jgi:hypothetical protein
VLFVTANVLRMDPTLGLTFFPLLDFTGEWASAISRQLKPWLRSRAARAVPEGAGPHCRSVPIAWLREDWLLMSGDVEARQE